jgi:ribosomal protein S18 acetylase RimI-like enzyme
LSPAGRHDPADPIARFVRPAGAADVDALVELAIRTGEDPETMRRRFESDLDIPERMLILATAAGQVAGYGRTLYFSPDDGALPYVAPAGFYLAGLLVAPSSRRQGLGRAITRARMAWAFERADEVWYFTSAGNRASIALHAELGFVEVTRDFSFPDVSFEGGSGVLGRAQR